MATNLPRRGTIASSRVVGGGGGGPDGRLVNRVQVGAYVHLEGNPNADPVAPAHLATIESGVGGTFDIIHYFFTWGRAFAEAINSNATGRSLMLSMKPDGTLVSQINSGSQDAYIDDFAADIDGRGQTVTIRYGHEMNGNWMSYSSAASGGPTAAQFKSSWNRVVTRMRAVTPWVKFLWCPNETDFPNSAGNHMEDYWPGDATVDYAGFDAYNWSNQTPSQGDGTWRTFEQTMAPPYNRIAAFTSKPQWVGEYGCPEAVGGVDPGGASKHQWFIDMFDSLLFPNMDAIIYFSEWDHGLNRDWRLDSSSGSLSGFNAGWHS